MLCARYDKASHKFPAKSVAMVSGSAFSLLTTVVSFSLFRRSFSVGAIGRAIMHPRSTPSGKPKSKGVQDTQVSVRQRHPSGFGASGVGWSTGP